MKRMTPPTRRSNKWPSQYVADLKQLPAGELEQKKDEARHVRNSFRYLARWKVIPADYAPKVEIDQLVKDHGWDKQPKK